MKFDSNRAWQEASASVTANRDVVLALTGVFFVLPALAFSLIYPQSEPPAGATAEQIFAMFGEYFASSAPLLIPMTIVQAAGTLALLTLFTNRTRPTVGEAIKQGFIGLIPYFLAQILIGIAFGLTGGLLATAAIASGVAPLIAIVVIAIFIALVYVAIKTSLVAPVIAVESERNPVAALKRSWLLTKGNSLRLAAFYVLIGLAFLVVIGIATVLIGLLATLIAGEQVGGFITAVISAILGGVMTLYFAAILAAVHRQLAGTSPDVFGTAFD